MVILPLMFIVFSVLLSAWVSSHTSLPMSSTSPMVVWPGKKDIGMISKYPPAVSSASASPFLVSIP